MHSDEPFIDEYTLGAFLAGDLPEEQRAKVLAYLAAHEDARELLCMAQDALEAAEAPVVEPLMDNASHPALPRAPARPAERRATSRFGARQGLTLLAVLVVAGIALFMNRPEPVDRFRSGNTFESADYAIEVTAPVLQFSWTEVPEAYYYRLVIMDVTTADVVEAHETRDTRLGRDDAFLLALHPKLDPTHVYEVNIEAVDVQNRRVHRFNPVEFSINP